MDTYTPQGGYTNQAQNVQSMANTLASITGSPTTGAYLAQAQAGPDYSGTDVSARMSDEEKLRTMFANDQVLAQKYLNPNLYGGSATPPADNPAGAFASPLQATIDSIMNPQGITTPTALIGAVGGDVTGQTGTLENVMNAMDFTKTRTLDAYKSMLQALSTLVSEEGANKRAKMQFGDTSGNSSVVDDYVEQVKGGLAISSIPNDAIRNAVVSKLSKDGWTPDKIKKNIEGQSTLAVMKSVKEAWDSSISGGLPTGGPFGAYGLAKKVAGYSKAEPDVEVYLRYKNAIVSTLRSLVGEKGILSNQDMQRIQDLLPDYGLTKEQAQKQWSNARKLLNSKYGEDIVNEYFGPETETSQPKFKVTPFTG